MNTIKLRFTRTKGDWDRQRYEQVVFKVKDSGNASKPLTGENWEWFSLVRSKHTRLRGFYPNHYSIQPESVDISPDGSIRQFLCSQVKNGKPTHALRDWSRGYYKIEVVDLPPRPEHENHQGRGGRVSTIRI